MQTTLDIFPLWALFLLTTALMYLSVFLGRRIGARARLAERESDSSVGAMVSVTLGLVAFLLAFTFGMATARFDTRRQNIVSEANAIGTAYLRAKLIPDPQRTHSCDLLREYTDLRIDASADIDKLPAAVERSEKLHSLLWAQAQAVAERDPHSVIGSLYIQSLNELIDIHAVRINGIRNRLPAVIWIALYFLSCLGMAEIGYYAAVTGANRRIAAAILILSFATVLLLLIDVDRPHEGFFKISQQPMLDTQHSIHADAANELQEFRRAFFANPGPAPVDHHLTPATQPATNPAPGSETPATAPGSPGS